MEIVLIVVSTLMLVMSIVFVLHRVIQNKMLDRKIGKLTRKSETDKIGKCPDCGGYYEIDTGRLTIINNRKVVERKRCNECRMMNETELGKWIKGYYKSNKEE